MPESLGEAVLDLRAGTRTFNRDIDGAERKAQSLDRTFDRIGRNLSGFGDKLSTRVTLPIIALGGAAFKMGAEAEEAANKFDVVMGPAADRVRERLKALEATVPLTTGEFESLAAGVQDLLVPMGLTRDAGADMSATFVEIAGDIAAFNDTSPKQVLDDIRSGLIGSSEPLQKYGVDTRVAALETVALKAGLIEEGEALTDVTRAQAVLIQIQARSTDALGTAAREAGSAAFESRAFARDIRQLGEEIGATLMPVITPMIVSLREAIKWFRDLSPEAQQLAVKIALAAAAIGPLLSITGRLIALGGPLVRMFRAATTATAANTVANTANSASLAGGAGLAKALGTATLALGAFWLGWKAGEFLADQLGIQENALSNWLDTMGFFGPSVQEIIADTNESAQAFGTYRTAAQIAADETARLAQIQADELAAALADTTANVFDAAAEMSAAEAAAQALADTVANAPDALAPAFDKATAAALRNKDAFTLAKIKTEELKQAILDARLEKAAANQAAQKLAVGVDKYAAAAKNAAQETTNFLGGFQTGIGFIDNFISKGLGKLTDALGGLFGGGGGGGILGGLFGGGGGMGAGTGGILSGLISSLTGSGGFESILSGVLGTGLTAALGPLGPLLSAGLTKLGGLAIKGLASLGGKVLGGIKSLFGGVSGAEKAGREVAASFRESIRSELSAEVRGQITSVLPKEIESAAFLASIQQKLIAVGVSAEAAGLQAQQWGIKLFEAEKKGGAAVQGVIDQITAATEAAIDSTTETAAQASAVATSVTSDFAQAQQKILADASTSATAQQAKLVQLSSTHRVTMQKMVVDTTAAQSDIASVAIGAAAATQDAWVRSASATVSAWKAARASTVGFSSITDIADIGSADAARLAAAQVGAAHESGDAWRRERENIEGHMDRLRGDGDERRRRDIAMDRRGGDDDFRSFGGDGILGGRAGGAGGNTLEINLIMDGERITRKVIKLTPTILRKMGLV